MGFTVAEGPEVESDWNNFDGAQHAARAIRRAACGTRSSSTSASPGSVVLRTHTSPVQIRVMQSQPPPIYTIMPGRVFRRDTADSTHMPVFHQIEGLVIDRGITLRRPRRHDRAVHQGVLRAVTSARACGRRTSRSPSRRPSTTSSVPTVRGSSSAGAAWSIRTCCATAASIPRSGAASRSASASTGLPLDAPRHRRLPRDVHQRHPLPESSSDEGAALLAPTSSRLSATMPIALGGADERPRPRRGRRRRGRRGGSTASSWRRCSRSDLIPMPTRSSSSTSTRATASRSRSCCGAFNMEVGDLVPLATLGTTMPNGMKIGRRKLRGESSNGMLCSPVELGFGDESRRHPHPPARPPPRDAAVGRARRRRRRRCSTSTSTRTAPTRIRMAGVARDLAARLEVPFDVARSRRSRSRDHRPVVDVTIVDADRCGRFTAA